MNSLGNILVSALLLLPGALAAQQSNRAASGSVQRGKEAQKGESAERWTLGDQSWDFKDIAAAYEPAKGHIESRNEIGELAVWKLKLKKDFEEGTQRLHEEMRGSPFKIVLLDADRTTINPDLPATITAVPARMGDTIELLIPLPDGDLLRDVKHVRIQRRTDVGF